MCICILQIKFTAEDLRFYCVKNDMSYTCIHFKKLMDGTGHLGYIKDPLFKMRSTSSLLYLPISDKNNRTPYFFSLTIYVGLIINALSQNVLETC